MSIALLDEMAATNIEINPLLLSSTLLLLTPSMFIVALSPSVRTPDLTLAP